MIKRLRALLCFVGLHQHEEVVDDKLTAEWFAWCAEVGLPNPTPCTFVVCKHCGHDYGSRTVGFGGQFVEKRKEANG